MDEKDNNQTKYVKGDKYWSGWEISSSGPVRDNIPKQLEIDRKNSGPHIFGLTGKIQSVEAVGSVVEVVKSWKFFEFNKF